MRSVLLVRRVFRVLPATIRSRCLLQSYVTAAIQWYRHLPNAFQTTTRSPICALRSQGLASVVGPPTMWNEPAPTHCLPSDIRSRVESLNGRGASCADDWGPFLVRLRLFP